MAHTGNMEDEVALSSCALLLAVGRCCRPRCHGSSVCSGSAGADDSVAVWVCMNSVLWTVPASGPANPAHGGRELDELLPEPPDGACGQKRRRWNSLSQMLHFMTLPFLSFGLRLRSLPLPPLPWPLVLPPKYVPPRRPVSRFILRRTRRGALADWRRQARLC